VSSTAAASGPNPLLSLRAPPLPFDTLRPEHVVPGLRELLARTEAAVAAIEASPGPYGYDQTLAALEDATLELELAAELVEHLESTATTPALREAWSTVQPEVSAFFSRLVLREGLYRVLSAYATTAEAKALTGERRRLLDKTLDDFRRHGATLPQADKEKLLAIDVELAELTLRYGQNVLDSQNAFELVLDDEARLAGLPESARAAARESARSKGREGYRLTLQAPSYVPALTYLDDARLREELWRANATRALGGPHDNEALTRRILELRRDKARLLGFASFADLVCDDRMAKNGQAARALVRTLRERARPHFERENQDLAAFRRELEGEGAPALAPWDVAYYAEKLRKARYDFDAEKLRPYFSLEAALEGAFELARRLYGLDVVPREGLPTWHRDVRCFSLVDHETGRALSDFYVDVFPREDKRDGAWMHGLVSALGRPSARSLEVLAANFTPPVGEGPALLRHQEVETLFHELGHLLHHALSEVTVRALAGTNVARDFVELPSQIMENWCWEREALDLFARHHETGERIPDGLFAAMQAARTFRAANAMMRQLGFAELDLTLHVDGPGDDLLETARGILEAHAPAPLPRPYAMVLSFSHLFSSPVGYAAGYYSYKWAEVLDADAFARFREEGLFSREVGRAFREHVLAKGDSEDPAELFRRFRGRDAHIEPLLERDGLGG
jgi:oligopeptidase A